MPDDLTVNEAAEALGTTPQTVRTLLRTGELGGRKQPWGRRFVWVPSRKGVDEFLSEHGRLDGRRRPRAAALGRTGAGAATRPAPFDGGTSARTVSVPRAPPAWRADPLGDVEADAPSPRRPFALRPRGRATVVVLALGVPLLAAYAAARVLPDALWFQELRQEDVYGRILAAKLELSLLVAGTVAIVVAANLAIAARGARVPRTREATLAIAAAAFVAATLFASAAAPHWQTFLLWRHRQPFGVADPIFGRDVGFFVFSLPFHQLVSAWLLWLIAVAAAAVAAVYGATGALHLRPPRATFPAQMHLAGLAAAFLLVVAWRFRLDQYALELGQASTGSGPVAGAGYVDVHVRSPGLRAQSILAVVTALACLAFPLARRTGHRRAAVAVVGVPAAALLLTAVSVASWVPMLVQRFTVDPNPLLREQPYLERSIAATRRGLGLAAADAHRYTPAGRVTAAEVSRARGRLRAVAVWNATVLEARMRDLVSQTPYYAPRGATFDVVAVDGRRRPTLVSAREIDIRRIAGTSRSWTSSRLAYTHGLGLVRFSATDVDASGQPRLLDAGLRTRQPRIYFGDLPARSPEWVLANTRRPEVDILVAEGEPSPPYHYDGAGGIALSSWVRRAVFASELESSELLLSDDITRESRLLLHRDVRDRLHALAPFVQWDSHPAALSADGRIVFVVEGYTTSRNYPYAQQTDLAGTRIAYARASVRATVDAFSGRVDLYLTDPSDPIARAWAEAFPTLFRPRGELSGSLRPRLRYPADLFDAQAAAYERFHPMRVDLFASNADVWSRPTSLSGSIEVAGDIRFDEDDEDSLRHRMAPGYSFAAPPGRERPRVLRSTYYSPRGGENLVGVLHGWVDRRGAARLGSRILARDRIILGPAQMSRLVFSTPRVSTLLGLTNLELRDVGRSSIDAVSLGPPTPLRLRGGIIQLQSLYKSASGSGASRLLGVTAFVNGRAGIGSDVEDAVRQALHEPPRISIDAPRRRVVVGRPARLGVAVKRARRAVVTITSPAGREDVRLALRQGGGTVAWVPSAPGRSRVHVEAEGLDGSRAADTITVRVVSPPPTIRLARGPSRAVVGRPVRFSFEVTHARSEVAQVSTPAGVLTRRYLIRTGTGIVEWIPWAPGPVELRVRARGRQGQTVSDTATLVATPRPRRPRPATITLLRVPEAVRVGREAQIAFRVTGARSALARIVGGAPERVWRFDRPAGRVVFTWAPTRAGTYALTISARHARGTTTAAARLTAVRAR